MKIQPGRNPYGFVLVQSAQHLQKNVIPSLWQCSTVTLQKWWMSILGNAMARNMKSRPGRNPYELLLVQSAWNLQKNDSYAFNSERNLFSTSSHGSLACVLLLLAVFESCWSIFSVQNRFSHIFPAPGGSSLLTGLMLLPTTSRQRWRRLEEIRTMTRMCPTTSTCTKSWPT